MSSRTSASDHKLSSVPWRVQIVFLHIIKSTLILCQFLWVYFVCILCHQPTTNSKQHRPLRFVHLNKKTCNAYPRHQVSCQSVNIATETGSPLCAAASEAKHCSLSVGGVDDIRRHVSVSWTTQQSTLLTGSTPDTDSLQSAPSVTAVCWQFSWVQFWHGTRSDPRSWDFSTG